MCRDLEKLQPSDVMSGVCVRFIILCKTGKKTNKGFIDLAYIMNTSRRVKEFFNITPGVSNQKGLNYKRDLSQQEYLKQQ